MLLPKLPFTVLDTETTGFIPKVNRVIEFASMQAKDGKIIDEYETLISIPGHIPAEVVTLTRITDDSLEGQPTFEQVAETITKHIGEGTFIIGQNIQFDIRMLKGEGIDLSNRLQLDTSMLASLVFPELASYSLPYMSAVLQLDHTPIHRALGDVRATVELLSKCWKRLHELTPTMYSQLQSVMQRAPEAYQVLFALVPKPDEAAQCSWITMSTQTQVQIDDVPTARLVQTDALQLIETPVTKAAIRSVVQGALSNGQPAFIAVKNVNTVGELLGDLDGVELIEPPSALLNADQVEPFTTKESFTLDEATLAVKLQWYTPRTKADIPLHGNEKDIWKSTLACSEQSSVYQEQFANSAPVKIMNHWQLLRSIDTQRSESAVLEHALNTQVIIDDATSLEDTATKALGYLCDCHTLRVASESIPELQSFADVLQLWIERLRDGQDQYYIHASHLDASDAKQIRSQITDLLALELVQSSAGIKASLEDLQCILDPVQTKDRIVWVEMVQDERQVLQSVPMSIASQLQQKLYDRFPCALLVPPNSQAQLGEIVPTTTGIQVVQLPVVSTVQLEQNHELKTEQILADPPDGKTVLLVSGRKRIEDIFVQYTERLEEQGVTLLCQGFNGGTSRIQAEFMAQSGPTILVITSFLFEVLDLKPNTITQLFIESLTFDHPNHTIVSKRAEKYQNAFMDYNLVRCEHRLYRILQALEQSGTPEVTATILDARLHNKRYGEHVWDFLQNTLRYDSAEDRSESNDVISTEHRNADKPEGWQLEMF